MGYETCRKEHQDEPHVKRVKIDKMLSPSFMAIKNSL